MASTVLAEGEAAELEYFLYHRAAFVWLPKSNSPVSIYPDGEEDICIEALGKRGLVQGTVCLDYASSETIPTTVGYYSRRIEVPLAITVNAALELIACDFTTFQSRSTVLVLKCNASETRFIVVLEFRNSWINSLQLEISVEEQERPIRKILQTLHSGQTRRFAIDLPQIFLSTHETEAPLPRRNKQQQFVVSSLSVAEALVRKAWWYRERILNSLSAEWSELLPGGRRGEVDLRGIRLSERHIPIVEKDAVGVEAGVALLEQTLPLKIVFRLTVIVTNLHGSAFAYMSLIYSDSPLTCMIHGIIAIRNQDENATSVCYDGVAQSPVMSVEAQQTASWSTELTFLATGVLLIGAVVERMSQGSQRKADRWSSNMCEVEIPEQLDY